MPKKNKTKSKPKKIKPSSAKQKKIKAKPNEIEKGLKSIYQDEKGKLPKMTGLEFKTKNQTLRVVIIIIISLAVLLTVSFIGFLVFQPTPKFSGNKINLEIKAPFTAISGEKITYQIKYTNLEDINFTNTQLVVYLPQGFIFEDATQDPLVENETDQTASNIKTWQINDLYINQSDFIKINGRLIGTTNSKQTISATLSYIPANFSSEFQKTISFNTEITDSLIDLEIEYPNQVANEEETEYTIKMTNTSSELDLDNLEIELNYPAEFTLTESEIINPDSESTIIKEEKTEDIITQKLWQVDNLLFQTQKKIKFKGIFNVTESQSAEFNLKIKLKGSKDEYFIQREKNFISEIIKGELLINLIIQGSNQNKAVNFGDTLNFLLNIQNKSKNTLGNIKIRAVIDSPFLDWSTLQDANNGLTEGNQILWTKEQIPKLALLFPEDEIDINLQIDIKDWQPSSRYKDEAYQIRSFFESQINKLDNNEIEIIAESNTIINEINSNLELSSQARYFDDNNQTIGSGPLPPIVNQETSYKIFWKITNSLHEIQNIEVKTKLPSYVTFKNQANISSGNLFINENNEIVWQISRIPTSIKQADAEFEISITPQADDVHKILTLLPEIIIKANDNITKNQINKSVSGITTNLDNDPLAKGKGLVQAE